MESEAGQSIIEYLIIVSLVAILSIPLMQRFGYAIHDAAVRSTLQVAR